MTLVEHSSTSRRLDLEHLSLRPAGDVVAAIGNTPTVELGRIGFERVEAFAKLEALNPGGSMKDRPAARMIDHALRCGVLRPGGLVVESSSGNLGVALAQTCAVRDLRLIVIVDEVTNVETVRKIQAYGAEVEIIRTDPADPRPLLERRIARVERLVADNPGAFWPAQYTNPDNPHSHRCGTMPELHQALGRIDAIFVPVSTTGLLRGVNAYCARHLPHTSIVAVDMVGSALFGGVPGHRAIPGIGAGVETDASRSARFDDLVRVTTIDAVIAARRLARREGILVGGSSGAVTAACGHLARTLRPGDRCAMVFADGGAPYLSTIFDDSWVEAATGVPADELATLTAGDRWLGNGLR